MILDWVKTITRLMQMGIGIMFLYWGNEIYTTTPDTTIEVPLYLFSFAMGTIILTTRAI